MLTARFALATLSISALLAQNSRQPTFQGQQPASHRPQMSEPTAAMASIRLDMNGIWEGLYSSPAIVKTIRITQNGDNITAEDLNGDESSTGRIFFRGAYGGPASHVQIEEAVYQGIYGMLGQPQSWNPEEMVIGDPDHFRIGNHPPFVRKHSPTRGDVPCDFGNRFHVFARGAYVRGNLQLQVKNYEESFCWYYVGSELGDRDAISQLGIMYHHGYGVAEDDLMAFKLFVASADAGSFGGAHNASAMYELGHGVPKDPAQAEVWRAKEAQLRANQQAQINAEQAADDKRQQGMETIMLLGRVAASVIGQAGMESPLCDLNSSTNSQSDIERKKDALKGNGMRCEDGLLRSAGR
jgi:hypothetical protein